MRLTLNGLWRQGLSAGALGLVLALGAAPTAHAAAPQQKTQAPGYYRYMLGQFEVTVLSDGTIDLDSKILKHAKPEELQALLSRSFQKSPNTTSINAFLINTGSQLVLVDTGAGVLVGPTAGRLLASLKAAGYEAAQVDAVLITHLHGDHFGGLTANGQKVFPNATVYLDQRESEHWLSQANLDAAPEAMKGYFQGPRAAAAPYQATASWKTFTGEADIVPGIRPLFYGAQPGHTPGHSGYLIESAGQKLLVWGDVVHSAAVQFAKPGVTIEFDRDQSQAAAARAALYKRISAEGWLVGAAHISFPGLGHIRQDGKAANKTYTWVPVSYRAEP